MQTYPLDSVLNALKDTGDAMKVEVLLSKSVAPAVTEWLYNRVLLDYFTCGEEKAVVEKEDGFGVRPVRKDRVWRLDLTVTQKRLKLLREGQQQM